MSCFEPLPASIGALASALAQNRTDEEIALLASIFTQLGDSLAVILAARACQTDKPDSV